MKILASSRLKAYRIGATTYYRGLMETWDKNKADKNHITFVTPDRDYALKYAKSEDHLYSFKATIKRPFDFGFRTLTTVVDLKEICARINKGVIAAFTKGWITKDEGLKLSKQVQALGLSKTGHKEVWEWYMSVPELSQILKSASYDAIEGKEDETNDVQTYGIFDNHNLVKAYDNRWSQKTEKEIDHKYQGQQKPKILNQQIFNMQPSAMASALKNLYDDYKSASSAISFFQNRMGKNLLSTDRQRLDQAREQLKKIYHKED